MMLRGLPRFATDRNSAILQIKGRCVIEFGKRTILAVIAQPFTRESDVTELTLIEVGKGT
jgi:hypothetical protein